MDTEVYNKTNQDRKTIFIISLVLFITFTTIYAMSMRDNIMWNGDVYKHLIQGMEILDNGTNSTTGIVRGDQTFGIRDQLYPPLASLVIAIPYTAGGDSILVTKFIEIVFFSAALVIFFLYSIRYISILHALFVVSLMFVSPYFFTFKEEMRADLVFLFAVYASIYYFDYMYRNREIKKYKYLFIIIIGILFYVAVGLRLVGVALPISALVFNLWRDRKISLSTILIIAVFGSLYFLQVTLLGASESGHTKAFFSASPTNYVNRLIRGALQFHYKMQFFVLNPHTDALSYLAYISIGALGAYGYFARLIKKDSIAEIFVLVYGGGILLAGTGSATARYLIPLYPLLFFYAYLGLSSLTKKFWPARETVISSALTALILVNFGSQYSSGIPFGTIDIGPSSRSAMDMFQKLGEVAGSQDVIMFHEPYSLHVYTGLTTGRTPTPQHSFRSIKTDDDKWRYFDSLGATFLVIKYSEPARIGAYDGKVDVFNNPDFRMGFVERNKDYLHEIHRNRDFIIYKISRDRPALDRQTP